MTVSGASARLYLDIGNPTVNDDSSAGYEVGNFWFNEITAEHFAAQDVSVGAAIWNKYIIDGYGGNLPTVASLEHLTGFDGAAALRSGIIATNTLLLQAYNTGGAAYTTFGTLTAGATPTFDATISTLTIGQSGSPTITSGSGAPGSSQPQGSLYLRTDGSGVNDRMYVATDAAGTWTAVVTVA